MIRFIKYLPILFILTSCWKEVSPNINISVSGYVVDTVKNKNIKNVKVVILGYKYSICLLCFNHQLYDTVKSIRTNDNGTFSMSFITNGKSDAYRIVVDRPKDDNYTLTNIEKGNKVELKVGNNANIRLQVREFTKLKAHVKILNNPYDTLYLDMNFYNKYQDNAFYKKHSIDTTITFNVLPMSKETLQFSTWIKSKNYELWSLTLDTITLKMDDTTFYSKTINILQLKKE